MNKLQDCSIDLTNNYLSVAVWQETWRGWQFIAIERFNVAVKIYRASDLFLFPPQVQLQTIGRNSPQSNKVRRFLAKSKHYADRTTA